VDVVAELPITPVSPVAAESDVALVDGSRVAVVGGGPAGSMFAYFLLDMADRVDLDLAVDIYEPRLFAQPGPVGCNMCGGIVSETLVQNLAIEGLVLETDVVQRGIDSYQLHTDVGSVRIATPNDEMRIGAVHRGGGPRDVTETKWLSFDSHLLQNAVERGATVIKARIEEIGRGADGHPVLTVKGGEPAAYDLVVVATGVNTSILKTLETLGMGYTRPKVTKTLIREYHLGEEAISASLGTSMHVFLLNMPRLEFAALIPKGDEFAGQPEVRAVMPAGWDPAVKSCQCLPHMNVYGTEKPYADRIVFIGDSGVTRLYKDGLGAAYRTAKAAARTAIFEGVSEAAFRDHFMPVCRSIQGDNRIGRFAFLLTRLAQRLRIARIALLRIVRAEQEQHRTPRLSSVMWDMFSGSAPYRDIFARMVHPAVIARGVVTMPGAIVEWLRPRRTQVKEVDS
jgi:hypothetical protein